tara:strand:+ start:175 stop:495 length:321 start_codon:yes stop_codon:yes gene_type:complete
MEKQKLNTTIIYVLSGVGFICCCIPIIGIIPAIIAFVMANSKHKEAMANPENYENPEAMKTAKIIALVVVLINALYLIWSIISIVTMGGWDAYMEETQRRMGEFGY